MGCANGCSRSCRPGGKVDRAGGRAVGTPQGRRRGGRGVRAAPCGMKFVLDHNLPPGLARALNELSKSEGHEVYPLREKFAEDVKDHAWISALGRESEWAVISGDISIFKVEEARVAWREAKLTIFFLAPGWAHL